MILIPDGSERIGANHAKQNFKDVFFDSIPSSIHTLYIKQIIQALIHLLTS